MIRGRLAGAPVPALWTAAVALAAWPGCGYAPPRVEAPPGVRRVAVSAFSTGGIPPEVGAWVATGAAERLASARDLTLANRGRADARIEGRVDLGGDEARVLARGAGPPRAVLASLRLRVRARLVDDDGRVLGAASFVVPVDRAVSTAPGADLAHEHRALRTAAADAGRRVVEALFAGRRTASR